MIIVKTPKTKVSKSKIRKYSLRNEFKCDELKLISNCGSIVCAATKEEKIKAINSKIEDINKRLERVRLLVRSIECVFNRNAAEETKDMIQMKENRTKGYYFGSVDSENGIFIH